MRNQMVIWKGEITVKIGNNDMTRAECICTG